ncbi:MAG TPA: hypothetical protein DCS67_12160 [Clostridiales bacterium UBA8960]|jgi:hypothetical protein|nr:hypothetical protein [Clostridiales bacterium UBA8960]
MGIIFAEKRTSLRLVQKNRFKDHLIVTVPDQTAVDARVSHHPDLSVFVHDKIYCESSICKSVFSQVERVYGRLYASQHVVCTEGKLGNHYPEDIRFNVLALTNHMFHLLSATDKQIINRSKLHKVNVRQGYTRCSCLPVGGNAIITEDESLGNVVAEMGYDVLVIERGHVVLEGFPYGFFGGTGGQIEEMIVFNGRLDLHPNHTQVKHFIESRGLSIVELHDERLVDCGSILYYSKDEERKKCQS